MSGKRGSAAERLWRWVTKTETCWLWTGAKAGGDSPERRYGTIRAWLPSGRYGGMYVHRLSWEIANGPIPEGMYVCHRCDVPLCVRPDHLFLGTSRENNADMNAKGRRGYNPNQRVARGEVQWNARLTEETVREVKRRLAAGAQVKPLARELGVSHTTIFDIRAGRTWKHV